MDVAFNVNSKTGAGVVVFRNNIGVLIDGVAFKFSANSILIAKALALRVAVIRAVKLNFKLVRFESDNATLTKACDGKEIPWEINAICNDILTLKDQFVLASL